MTGRPTVFSSLARPMFLVLLLAGAGLLPFHRADSADEGPQLRVAEEESPPARALPTPAAPPREFLGADQCLRCHSSGLPEAGAGGDPVFEALFDGAIHDDSWVLFNEVRTWARDKHSQAYLSLLNERSQRMGQILGVTEIHRDRRCLACHSGHPVESLPVDPQTGLAAETIEADRRVLLGVSCEGCHGPAGRAPGGPNGEGWYVAHAAKEPWRFLSPEVKLETYGFQDVRSPAARAKLCLSCHLGDAAEGKIVTHEMYAAGHPPLPPFEIETFLNQMPPHWRDLEEKPSAVRQEFLQRTGAEFDPDSLDQTRDMLIGAILSLSENVRLTVDLAEGATASFAAAPWPELAQFDCFACHHDLRNDGWRQRRGWAGPPGRPALREWPHALARIAIEALADDQGELEGELAQIRDALHQQPFGVRSRLVEHGRGLVQSAEALASKLAGASLSRSDGERIRRAIADAAATQVVDYDSARQLIWAFRVVDGELEDRRADDEIAQILASLDDEFVLDLRAGQTVQQMLPGSRSPRETKEVDLSKTLPPIAAYDPAGFQQRFQRISALLEK